MREVVGETRIAVRKTHSAAVAREATRTTKMAAAKRSAYSAESATSSAEATSVPTKAAAVTTTKPGVTTASTTPAALRPQRHCEKKSERRHCNQATHTPSL